jgi:hypothetical protein
MMFKRGNQNDWNLAFTMGIFLGVWTTLIYIVIV